MISKTIIDALRHAELFGGLTPMQITEIARHAERVMFPADHVIARLGEQASGGILIIDGSVERLAASAHLPRAAIAPGSMIAEMAMFTEFEHGATFVARASVKAMRIPRHAMLAQMADDPDLAARLLDKVAGRLRQVAIDLAAAGDLLPSDDKALSRHVALAEAAARSESEVGAVQLHS